MVNKMKYSRIDYKFLQQSILINEKSNCQLYRLFLEMFDLTYNLH